MLCKKYYTDGYITVNTRTAFSMRRVLHIGGFHMMLNQASFASHHTRDRHVGFLTLQAGIGKYNKMSQNFLLSAYHNSKLQPSDKYINTHTRLEI